MKKEKQWLTLKWKDWSLDTSYNNRWRSHVAQMTMRSQDGVRVWAMIMLPVACSGDGPPATSPTGMLIKRRGTKCAAMTESVPSGHPEHTSTVISCECSYLWLWHYYLYHTYSWKSCFSCQPALFSFRWEALDTVSLCWGWWRFIWSESRVSYLKETDMPLYALTDMQLWPLTLSASQTWLHWLASISSSWGMSASGCSQSQVTFRHKSNMLLSACWRKKGRGSVGLHGALQLRFVPCSAFGFCACDNVSLSIWSV